MTESNVHKRPPNLLAREILDAWVCGDQPHLSRALENAVSPSFATIFTRDGEYLVTLQAIAHEMMETPDLFAPRSENPRIGSWMSLLDHLAGSRFLPLN